MTEHRSHARLAIALGIVAVLAFAYSYTDLLGDSFWYIAGGRLLLEKHAFAMPEPFSFASTATWIPHMVLSEVIFARVADHLGLRSLVMLGAVVFTGAIAFAWLYGARRWVARLAVLPLALLVVWLQRDDLNARGQVFGDVTMMLLIFLLDRLRAGKRVHVAIPIVLSSVWINLHSSAVAAPMIAVAYAATLLTLPREQRPSLVPFVLFAAALALGLFVNPLGHVLVVNLAQIAVAGSTAKVNLFAPPSYRSADLLVLAVVVIGVALLLVRRPRGTAAGWPDALFLLMWLAGACLARRHIETLSLLLLIHAGRLADARLADVSRRTQLAILSAASVLVASLVVRVAVTKKDPLAQMPTGAVDAIEQLGLRDNVANPMHWGGYLAWAWYGKRKLFLDGRYQPFQNGVFDDFFTLYTLGRGWEQILDVYDIQTVLWERDSPLDAALRLHPAWQEVYRSGFSVVYTRKQLTRPTH